MYSITVNEELCYILLIAKPGKLKGIVTDRDMRLACDSPFLEESLSVRVKHLADHKVCFASCSFSY